MLPLTYEIVALDVKALEQNLGALARILHACVHDGASVSFILPFDTEQAGEFWRQTVAPAVAANKRVVLVAKAEGELAGTVQLNLDTTPNQAHRAEISKLLVHPRFRRLGVGQALMREIEQWAVRYGRWLLTLDTAGEAALTLYSSLGYERAGCIPDYARDPIEDRYDATTFMYKILPQAKRGSGAG